MPGVHDAAARGFSRSADAYDRARPDYPPAAVAWLAERLGLRPGRTVVDLAAGTGKLTRPLAATGAEVVAIEPVAEMRARIGDAAARALDGTAEAIPLPDASADAVTVAPGVPLVRRSGGAGGDPPGPAAGRRARARLEPPPARGPRPRRDRADHRAVPRRRARAPQRRLARRVRRDDAVRPARGADVRAQPAARRRRARRPRRLDELRRRARRRPAGGRHRGRPRARGRRAGRAALRLRGVRVRPPAVTTRLARPSDADDDRADDAARHRDVRGVRAGRMDPAAAAAPRREARASICAAATRGRSWPSRGRAGGAHR